MKNFKLIIYPLFFITLFSCVTNSKINSKFYSDKKVGVLIQVDPIDVYNKEYRIIDVPTINSENKYKEALNYIETEVTPKLHFKNIFLTNLEDKNKPYIFLEENVNLKDFPRFINPELNRKGRIFYVRDLSSLKLKYNIDQLAIIEVKYGLLIDRLGMFVMGKSGYAHVHTKIINLNNNSVLHKSTQEKIISFEEKWNTPPYYKNLKESIEQAVLQTAFEFSTKL